MADRLVVGYVPGGFDMLHVGHLNILRAAAEHCDRLVAGVATDDSLLQMKGRLPVVPFAERLEMVRALRCVDDAVADVSRDKRVAWRRHPFDVLFKGDDWKDTPKGVHLEAEMREVGARLVYLPYTPTTSSTMLRGYLTSALETA